MASDPFVIYNQELVDVDAVVTSNGKFLLKTTPTHNNNQSMDSLLVVVDFDDITPNPDQSSPGWALRAVIESSNGGGLWRPVGAMFEPLRHPAQGKRQVIIVQPNILNLDEGVPIDVWDGQGVTTRLHRQQGILGVDFRVVLEVIETKHGTADALQSLKLTINGERYQHAG